MRERAVVHAAGHVRGGHGGEGDGEDDEGLGEVHGGGVGEEGASRVGWGNDRMGLLGKMNESGLIRAKRESTVRTSVVG